MDPEDSVFPVAPTAGDVTPRLQPASAHALLLADALDAYPSWAATYGQRLADALDLVPRNSWPIGVAAQPYGAGDRLQAANLSTSLPNVTLDDAASSGASPEGAPASDGAMPADAFQYPLTWANGTGTYQARLRRSPSRAPGSNRRPAEMAAW